MNTIVWFAAIAALALASIIVNVLQWRSRREYRKDSAYMFKQCARLEVRLDELENEKGKSDTHVKWAISKIKDLSSTNKSLKEALRLVSKDRWKEWQTKHKEEEEGQGNERP